MSKTNRTGLYVGASVQHPRFYTKEGWLTPYAMACGYIHRTEVNRVSVEFWSEHQHYHVRSHCYQGGGRLAWDTFTSITAARSAFLRHQRMYQDGGAALEAA